LPVVQPLTVAGAAPDWIIDLHRLPVEPLLGHLEREGYWGKFPSVVKLIQQKIADEQITETDCQNSGQTDLQADAHAGDVAENIALGAEAEAFHADSV
jgi:hypothetical protein